MKETPSWTRSQAQEQRCLSQLAAALDRLDSQCSAPWYFGDRLSHADVMSGCLIGYLNLRLPESFPADRYPALHLLAQHCERQDEFVKSRISPDETMPGRR